MEPIINLLAQLYKLVIIAAAVVSWVRVDPYHPVVQFLRKATEPFFARIREFVPPLSGFDLSPLIAYFLVWLVQILLIKIV
jgi:YggT family protein